MDFAAKLTQLRKKRALSQEQLGEMVGIDKRIISKYETSRSLPSVETARAIAKALNVSLDYMLDLEFSVFIDDSEMRRMLRDFNQFTPEDKETIKHFLKAWSVYHQVKATEKAIKS